MAKITAVTIFFFFSSFSTKCFSNVFSHKQSQAASRISPASRWAWSNRQQPTMADPAWGCSYQHVSGTSWKWKIVFWFLTLQLLKSTCCCWSRAHFRPSRLGRFFLLSSWPENCQTNFPDTLLLTHAWAMAILCLRSWISSQNNL